MILKMANRFHPDMNLEKWQKMFTILRKTDKYLNSHVHDSIKSGYA